MRLALLHPLPSVNRWSMDTYHEQLSKSLLGLLRENEELLTFPGGDSPQRGLSPGGTGQKLLQYWQHYVQYGLTAWKLKADLYHITDHGYGDVAAFLDLSRTVVSFHDALLLNLDEGKLPVKTKPWTAILAQRYALQWIKQSAHVITISEFSRREYLDYTHASEEQVTAIHLGIHNCFFQSVTEDEKSAFRKKWKLPEDAAVILMSGRTDPHKNIEGSLKAFAHLKKLSQVPMVLIKTGGLFSQDQQKLIKKLDLSKDVLQLGPIPYADLPLVYQSADALLFLSFYEGFGFPVLEAMASGIPAVISNCGSLPEIAGDAALYANPQNPEQAAECLYKVLHEPALRSVLIAKGKNRAAGFTWEQTARKTMEVYRRVLR